MGRIRLLLLLMVLMLLLLLLWLPGVTLMREVTIRLPVRVSRVHTHTSELRFEVIVVHVLRFIWHAIGKLSLGHGGGC